MFEVQSSVPKPKGVEKAYSTVMKYPFADMKTGQSFFVPKSEMLADDTPQKFRVRIQKSSANWARRVREERGKRETFTVTTMETDHEPEEGEPKLYEAGDVGVWMD